MESRTDIAIILPSLAGGGAERVALFLCNKFCKRGLLVDLVIINNDGPLSFLVPKEARLIILNCKKPIRSIIKLVKYIKKAKPLSIFSFLTHVNIASSIAKIISCNKTKIVLSERIDINFIFSKEKYNFDSFLTKILVSILYKRANSIIAVSEGVSESIRKNLKFPPQNTEVIYNPIDFEKILLLSKDEINFPWKDNLPIIISLGRLTSQKDFSCILEAFLITKQRHPSHLVILGEGEQRELLHQLSEQLKISDDVWLPGFQDNPYPFLARSSLYVLSSRFEGLPNVLIEALALNIPIVSTNCPSGPKEILANGKYGRLVPVGDPIALAEAMDKSLSGDHPIFDQKEALQRFDPELITDQYLEALGFHNLPNHSHPIP
ncbi:MAG: glycosyltransferase [Candidatus Moranbacteria bacterium]|nr:glycosyltransferase [Candidatus Moranbacteria bacterium]